MLMLALLLLACAPDPSPRQILLELAGACAESVYPQLQDTVEAELGVSLWSLADGTTLSGSVDGDTLDADWALVFRAPDGDAGQKDWDWTLAVTALRLELDSGVPVEARGDWTVADSAYDVRIALHTWTGALEVDGADAQALSFEAVFSGNLHRVTGTLGDTAVAWENSAPDLP